MPSQKTRELELKLAVNPQDLESRIQLLLSYQRNGILTSSELMDLAALQDPGAMYLVGRDPGLESRSKRFYLRCTWVIIHAAFQQLDPNEITKMRQLEKQITGHTEVYDLIFDAIPAFDTLVIKYLNKTLLPEENISIKLFRQPHQVTLKNFHYIFRELLREFIRFQRTRLERMLRSQEPLRSTLRESTTSIAFAHFLHAYLALAYNTQGRSRGSVKSHTNEALSEVASGLDSLQNVSYYARPDLQQRFPTSLEYYDFRTLSLLAKYREAIIQQWLPGYTP